MLTTEQLRARAESLELDFFIERRAGVWVKEWLNNGCTSATAEEVMMWSMLADREAQPVAWTVGGFASHDKKWAERRSAEENLLLEPLYRHPVITGIDENHYDPELEPGLYVAEIMTKGGAAVINGYYTAPPAPANANPVAWEMRYWNSGHNCWHDWERITAEQHAEMSAEHATDNDYEFRILYDAPPAPAVPDIKIQKAILWLDGVIQSNPGMKEPVTCRAAMLAQPVSSGYKFVPVEPTEDMIAAAMNCDDVSFNADETFCVNFGNIYAAMLAAAPESGNDHDTRR